MRTTEKADIVLDPLQARVANPFVWQKPTRAAGDRAFCGLIVGDRRRRQQIEAE